jgi:hypothetical protein
VRNHFDAATEIEETILGIISDVNPAPRNIPVIDAVFVFYPGVFVFYRTAPLIRIVNPSRAQFPEHFCDRRLMLPPARLQEGSGDCDSLQN